MSDFADRIEARFDKVEADLLRLSRESYSDPARRRDNEILEIVRRTGKEWVACPLGTVVASRPVVAFTRIALGSYTGGGIPAADLDLPPVPNRVHVEVPIFRIGAGDWTFRWVNEDDVLKMYDDTGAEIAGATDVSAVQTWPATVYGTASPDLPCFRASGPCRVLAVEFEATDGVPQDDADYWTIQARRRSADDDLGETIGTIWRTSVFRIDAYSPIPLYPEETPTRNFDLDEGDRLFVRAEETGQPEPLVGAVAWILLQRLTR